MFPQASTLTPAASSRAAVKPVVVVFPFVPVIATTGQRQLRKASSISPKMGTPASADRLTIGVIGSIPGLSTAKSKFWGQRRASSPRTTRAPLEESRAAVFRRGTGSPESSTVTATPSWRRRRVAAWPLWPRPRTTACFPREFITINAVSKWLVLGGQKL